MKFLSFVMMTFALSLTAQADSDLYDCGGTAVKAALSSAKQYIKGEKVTFGSIYEVRASDHQELTVYEISLLKWSDSDSFGLDYEVVVRGRHPHCKVVRAEIVGEE